MRSRALGRVLRSTSSSPRAFARRKMSQRDAARARDGTGGRFARARARDFNFTPRHRARRRAREIFRSLSRAPSSDDIATAENVVRARELCLGAQKLKSY